ncbi:hypothetical protein PSTT_16720, partial [Puccinia striiformis]
RADSKLQSARLERTWVRLGCHANPADEPAWADVLDIWSFKSATPPCPTRICPSHRADRNHRGGRRGFMASSLRGQTCLTSGRSSGAHHLVRPESSLGTGPTRDVGSGAPLPNLFLCEVIHGKPTQLRSTKNKSSSARRRMDPIHKRSHTPEVMGPPITEVAEVRAPSPQLGERRKAERARSSPMKTTPNKPVRYSRRLFNKFHGDGSFDMNYRSWKDIKAEQNASNKKPQAKTPTRPRQGNEGPSDQRRRH